MEKDFKPTQLYYHEALDRSHVVCDSFYEYVAGHPIIENDEDLAFVAEMVVDVLQSFYQLIGSKAYGFEHGRDKDEM